jgi:hypothetical protein
MKVTTLETYLLSAPLPQAVRTSTHTITRVSEVVVKLTTDAGRRSWSDRIPSTSSASGRTCSR